ncbi:MULTISPECIES: endonuclease V [Streptomyces]|uniref:Endonuclease V n=1 Tax=Streptomyces malaysiensis TaxID=92644 RepID=A0A2J7YV00_STRMQ|nr:MULTISPECIES: endonuclease V [Streptomyces]PNG91841.1 Endonuclease V [Streptomyces malaysiensis]WHX24079.1 endonuclease V [Streptomyces sp. NA07423]
MTSAVDPRYELPRDWPSTEAEAIAVQERTRGSVVVGGEVPAPGTGPGAVVGVDVAYDDERDLVAAAAVALDARGLDIVAEATAVGRVTFPYVPGLLAFREIPAVLDALGDLDRRLGRRPDLVVCDGYGLAHPRRFGLASHLGVLTGLPTIGVAKNLFGFRHADPGPRRGDWAPLLDGEEEVGRALRTRDGVKPLFVSVGHRVTITDACAYTLHLARDFRQPETTRRADALCRRALKAATL